jgi:DNA-binding NtrC family response regulator
MSQPAATILVVDDEPAQRQFLRAALRNHEVVAAASGEEALQLLSSRSFDLVISDQKMPGMSGIELLQWIREQTPETPVLILTAYGTIDSAVEAVKLGAEDYLIKPVQSPDEIRVAVARTLDKRALAARDRLYRAAQEAEFPADIVAESAQMREVLRLAQQVAPQPTSVLLTGESGTGKEVVARYIHRCSPRAEEAFVAVNCAALTESLLESELFGHEKGAFTGATQARQGRFELAHGGTLFLDEIGEMSFDLQSKLLRALQEQSFERVGGTRTITVDVRVIAATNRDLGRALEEKNFREDLYYRLNVFPLHLPPLRDRREDILPLARHIIRRLAPRMGRPVQELSREAEQILLTHRWPGNIRELQNAIERAMIVSAGSRIEADDLPIATETELAAPHSGTLAELEKAAILEALTRNGGDRRTTARELGISLRTLQYRLKEYRGNT